MKTSQQKYNYVDYKDRSNTSNNRGTCNHLQTTQEIPEHHTGKVLLLLWIQERAPLLHNPYRVCLVIGSLVCLLGHGKCFRMLSTKTCRGMAVLLPLFLMSALDWGPWPGSRSGHFKPNEKAPWRVNWCHRAGVIHFVTKGFSVESLSIILISHCLSSH